MKFKISIILLLFLGSISLSGQEKTISISQELKQNSEMLKVKMGAQWMGKIMKFKFGDYAVVTSKNKAKVSKHQSNFFGTKSQGSSEDSFSFELTNKEKDTAYVAAINRVDYKQLNSFALSEHLYLGTDELLVHSEYFVCDIVTSRMPEDSWVLIIENTQGSDVETVNKAFLTNDKRLMHIITTPTYDDITKGLLISPGVEIVENDMSLAAVQFYGPGFFGANKKFVWLHNTLDSQTELILSSAIVSILQWNMNQLISLTTQD